MSSIENIQKAAGILNDQLNDYEGDLMDPAILKIVLQTFSKLLAGRGELLDELKKKFVYKRHTNMYQQENNYVVCHWYYSSVSNDYSVLDEFGDFIAESETKDGAEILCEQYLKQKGYILVHYKRDEPKPAGV